MPALPTLTPTRAARAGLLAGGPARLDHRVHFRGLIIALSSLLISCAQGVLPDEVIEDVVVPDAGHPVDASPDTAAQIQTPIEEPVAIPPEAGMAPVPDSSTGTRDAGMEAGPLQPVDAGKPETSTPLDAAPDTSTPVKDSGPETSTPVDTGVPDAPSALMCSAAPAYPTSTDCAKCICTKCASMVMSCYASSDSAKNTQCAAVQACAEQNHCTGADCLCGDSVLCLSPNGKCRQVIETAAGTSNALDIQRLGNDTSTSVGRANAIGTCESSSCKSECGL
jgi:hypothetical protein